MVFHKCSFCDSRSRLKAEHVKWLGFSSSANTLQSLKWGWVLNGGKGNT